jgi:hypothetical protein
MSEFTTPVAKTDPITETAMSRKNNSARKTLLTVVAAGLVLTACAESPVAGKGLPATTVATSAEAAPTTMAPTATETTPTTTAPEATESSSASAEIDVRATLCDKAEALGITEQLGRASCTAVTTDKYFDDVLDGARWQSTAGTVEVKVIKDPNGTQFGDPGKWHGINVQSKERDRYGLQDYNPICNEVACYTLQRDSDVYGDNDVVFEVAGASREQELALLGRMVNGDN